MQSKKLVKIIKYFLIQSSKMHNILDYHAFLMRSNLIEIYFPNIVPHNKYYTWGIILFLTEYFECIVHRTSHQLVNTII